MPFRTDGKIHHDGIKNEIEIVNYMNENPDNAIVNYLQKNNDSTILFWTHAGGTRQKKDCTIHFNNGNTMGVSIKNHNGGTFDWENTSMCVFQNFIKLKEEIKDFKNKYKNEYTSENKNIRDELSEIFSGYLYSLLSDDIEKILNNIYIKENNTKYIIINNNKSNKLILLEKSNLDSVFNSKYKHIFILKKSTAKTSRQIWIKSADGNEINTDLRIRLNLNNGITALFCKSSYPCLKIQQDKVKVFINKCSDKVIIDY